MRRLHFTLLAYQDLDEIYDYISQDSNETALRFVARLEDRCRSIAEMPGTGRVRDELGLSLRSVAEGKYIIFYRPIDNGIEIIRVLHGARDIERFFQD